KEHNQRLVEASISSECRLPFIPNLHADIVKAPTDIKFGEVLSPLELVDELRDEGEWVLVFHCDVIEGSIVLDQSKRAIFLFDEEDRRCHRRLGWSDTSCFQVF